MPDWKPISKSKITAKISALKVSLSPKSVSENLQEIIKRDFVQLANETIKNEQEDLRKQNRESLEEKIQPLTKELGEFKQKIENFNLKGVENTTKIVEQITNLEKNNKVIEQEGVSSIFDSKVYSYLPYIKELSENINMFIADSLFFETSYIKEVVELIKKAHQGIDVTNDLVKLDESISFTDGFLNKKIGLM